VRALGNDVTPEILIIARSLFELAQFSAKFHHCKASSILSLTPTPLVFYQTSGLLVGSLMVAHQITSGGEPQASKFVVFITYLAQVSVS